MSSVPEWFVLCEAQGSGAWHPVRVVLGRPAALQALSDGYRLTWDEQRRIEYFQGSGKCLIVAGPDNEPHRRITKVEAPCP